jgi:formiminotetrahydrofolate cyclodeaminase
LDVEVGAKALEAAAYGAHKNVMINLCDIKDEEFKKELTNKAETLLKRAEEKLRELTDMVAGRTGDV